MSKENALRFMIIKDKDESIKNAYDSVMGKYREKNLSEAEQDNVVREEIVSLAKQCGFDFTPQEMIDLKETAEGKLSDEELNEIVGEGAVSAAFFRLRSTFPIYINLRLPLVVIARRTTIHSESATCSQLPIARIMYGQAAVIPTGYAFAMQTTVSRCNEPFDLKMA